MEGHSMDVDLPFNNKSNLKRSNSAPMINVLNTVTSQEEIVIQPIFENQPRTRRFSASCSFSGLSPCSSPSSPFLGRTPPRITQIKHEEGMDIANREAAHERKVQSALQISQSWEDLTLTEPHDVDVNKRPRCFTEPLHIVPSSYPLSSSPSPTRLGKQCFSPSMQQPVRNISLCTSPVPSPTRKSVARRSHSPIALRPSQLPMKRKFDYGEKMDCYPSPQKRFNSGSFAPDRVTHSLSSSSLDDSSSPDPAISLSAANTPESLSSSDSPGSVFKPVDPDSAMQDSEPPTPTSSDGILQENCM